MLTKEQMLKSLEDSIFFEDSGKCWACFDEQTFCPYCHKEINEKCDCEGWEQLQKDCAEIRTLKETYTQKLEQIREHAQKSVLPFFKKWYRDTVYKSELNSINSDLEIVENL